MTRFKEILGSIGCDTRYNLHSHTQFCDGHADMEAMTRGAVSAGLTHYGFSPHSPLPIASPCNMLSSDVPAYMAEVRRLQEIYAEQINLYTAMEVDYLGPQWGPASHRIQEYRLDYIIGSVHFVPTRNGEYIDTDGPSERFRRNVHERFGDDLRYVVDTFFSQTQAMIKAGGLDIVGHFDKISLNASTMCPDIESEPWYIRHINNTIDCMAATGVVAEINTKAYARHKRFFPDLRWWRRMLQAGVPVIINSDSHDPELTDASRDEAFSFLDTLR